MKEKLLTILDWLVALLGIPAGAFFACLAAVKLPASGGTLILRVVIECACYALMAYACTRLKARLFKEKKAGV